MTYKIQGLYAITDSQLISSAHFGETVMQAIQGGTRILQYRDKSSDKTQRLQQAHALAAICQRYGVIFIVNDDIQLAAQVQADGVHLGRDDAQFDEARQLLGARAIIGVSCYNCLDLAARAVQQGANYLAFGSFFKSVTKPNAVPASLALLSQARRQFNLPIVAIGGITPENGGALLQAGADALAVIQGVFGCDDVFRAAQAYDALFNKNI